MNPLRQVLAEARAAGPERTALVHEGRRWSYAELSNLADETERALRKLGVGAGSRVGVRLPNSPELIAAYMATWGLDAAVVEASPSLGSAEQEALFRRSGAVATIGIGHGASPAAATAGAERAPGADAAPVACVNLTSGTTGAAKGVLLPPRNLLRNAELFAKYFGLGPSDRSCLVLPLYFGMNKIALLAHLRLGATVILEAGFATPNTALAAMSREKATGLCAVPAACQALLSRGDLQRYPQPQLRYLRMGAGRVPAALMEGLRRAFPATDIFVTYGLTEIGLVSCLSADEHARRPESVGRPIDEVELTIDGGGAGPGEVVVRGDHAALGYEGDRDATAAVFREDGIHTGDLGRLDEAGYLFLTGRLKELIKSGGENVHPGEVEAVLLAHPAVADCAVVGAPDPWLGETVLAYVALRRGATGDGPALMRYCMQALPPIRRPRRIVIVDSIPRNAVGKVVREELT
jgi:acyl-CoA synthetase (AMP-forming)/AMP-acid ligase II